MPSLQKKSETSWTYSFLLLSGYVRCILPSSTITIVSGKLGSISSTLYHLTLSSGPSPFNCSQSKCLNVLKPLHLKKKGNSSLPSKTPSSLLSPSPPLPCYSNSLKASLVSFSILHTFFQIVRPPFLSHHRRGVMFSMSLNYWSCFSSH